MLAAPRSPSSTELAWAAGFFDGEGNVVALRTAKRRQDGSNGAGGTIRIQITQTDPGPLTRFRDAVGVGAVTGPYGDDRPNHRPTWRYAVNGSLSFAVVWNLLGPHLCDPKRGQFHEAWRNLRDHYASVEVRRNDPRRLPPEPV